MGRVRGRVFPDITFGVEIEGCGWVDHAWMEAGLAGKLHVCGRREAGRRSGRGSSRARPERPRSGAPSGRNRAWMLPPKSWVLPEYQASIVLPFLLNFLTRSRSVSTTLPSSTRRVTSPRRGPRRSASRWLLVRVHPPGDRDASSYWWAADCMKWPAVLGAAKPRSSKQYETSGFGLPLLQDVTVTVLAQRERRGVSNGYDYDQQTVSLVIEVRRDTEGERTIALNVNLVRDPLGHAFDANGRAMERTYKLGSKLTDFGVQGRVALHPKYFCFLLRSTVLFGHWLVGTRRNLMREPLVELAIQGIERDRSTPRRGLAKEGRHIEVGSQRSATGHRLDSSLRAGEPAPRRRERICHLQESDQLLRPAGCLSSTLCGGA